MGLFSEIKKLTKKIEKEVRRPFKQTEEEITRVGKKIGRETTRLGRDIAIPFEQMGDWFEGFQPEMPEPPDPTARLESGLGALEELRKRKFRRSVSGSARTLVTGDLTPSTGKKTLLGN